MGDKDFELPLPMTVEEFLHLVCQKHAVRQRPLLVKILAGFTVGRAVGHRMASELGMPVNFTFNDGSTKGKADADLLNGCCDQILSGGTSILLVCATQADLWGVPDLSSRADILNIQVV